MLPSAVLLADYAGTVDVSDHVETRARETEGAIKNPAFDIVDTGIVSVRASDRRWDYTFAYSPTLTLPDLELGWTPQLLQSGSVGVAWHTRRVRISLTESATYGRENTAYLPAVQGAVGGAPATIPTLTAPTTIEFGSSRTFLGTDVALTRRLQLGADVGYMLQGGLDASSRAILPFLAGPRADARLSYAATRLDTLLTDAFAQRSDSATGPCSALITTATPGEQCQVETEIVQASESWRRQLARHDWVSVGAGVALARTRLSQPDPFENFVYPVALASYEHVTRLVSDALDLAPDTGSARAVLRIDAQLAPYIDMLSGAEDYRAQATASLSVPIHRTTVRGALWATQSVESHLISPITMFRVDLDVEQHVSDILSVGVGARYAWQSQEPLGVFQTGMLYAQATVRAPVMKF